MVMKASEELEDGGVLPLLANSLNFLELLASRIIAGPKYLMETKMFGDKRPCLNALALEIQSAGVVPTDHFPDLAHLRIAGGELSIVRLLRLLDNIPRLETLYIKTQLTVEVDGDTGVELPTVNLNFLQALSFSYPGVQGASTFLAHLVFPSSTNLQLHGLLVCDDADIRALQIPLHDSSSVLEVIAGENLHIRARGGQAGGALWLHFRARGPSTLAMRNDILRKLMPTLGGVTTLRAAGFLVSHPYGVFGLLKEMISLFAPRAWLLSPRW
ncbi:hypothetical protein C8Q74DRAFT_100078 [Fomes fomentarius]|nr:hypothetical protein C8Q74DRAFT_100078 [Fomes fomentarius]